MSIKRQLEIMESVEFENGIDKKDPIFQMKDMRLSVDQETSEQEQLDWWSELVSVEDYNDALIAVLSVNCTTINQEFNPNDPMNDKLFDFDPIRYLCMGPPDGKFNCKFTDWT